MIRHIISLLVVAFSAAPFGIATRVLLNNFIRDKRASKRAKKAEKKELMDRDWNFNTVWLYDNPIGAVNQVELGWSWHECLICRYIYGGPPHTADWKVGYSCLKSMDVHIIGYCNKHYTYLLNEKGEGRLQCNCGEEMGNLHDFEEIMMEAIV